MTVTSTTGHPGSLTAGDAPHTDRPRSSSSALAGAPWATVDAASVGMWAQLRRIGAILRHVTAFLVRSRLLRASRATPHQVLQREGQWIRESATALGGTFVKLAQQASIRRDVLPEAYCDALDGLQDAVDPMPFATVQQILERQWGRPLATVLRTIDPEPVGSASVGCVYRAELSDGTEIAVKVRRPGIAASFALDLSVMERMLRLMQLLAVPTLGLSVSMIDELKQVLQEELDLRSELRYQDLFRRAFRHWKQVRITSPRSYYELSGSEVMVSEYVRGVSLKEMLVRLRTEGEPYRQYLTSLGIDPRNIARRLVRGLHFQVHECPFFHADPHPGNIVVQPGGQLVFLDFGACGVMPERDRHLLMEMNQRFFEGDVVGMVQCVTGIMEPLPRIDTNALTAALEREWWRGYYGIISRHAEWHERTSFRLWTVLMVTLRQFDIPLPSRMLKLVRATLLYDTVAAQLDADINVFREFLKFTKAAAKRRRRAIRTAAFRQLALGPDDAVVDRTYQMGRVARRVLYRAEKFLNEPDIRLDASIDFVVGVVREFWTLAVTMFATASSLWLVSYSWRRYLYLYDRDSYRAGERLIDLPGRLVREMAEGEPHAFVAALALAVGTWWMLTNLLGIAERLRRLFRQQNVTQE